MWQGRLSDLTMRYKILSSVIKRDDSLKSSELIFPEDLSVVPGRLPVWKLREFF